MRLLGPASIAQPRLNLSSPIDSLLNLVFGLNERASQYRGFLILPFLIVWPVLGIILNREQWALALYGLLDPSVVPVGINPMLNLIWITVQSWFAPRLVIHMLALYIPPLISWLIASVYLSEIFELGNASIARHFLSQSAFHFPAYERLTIDNEKLSKDQKTKNTIIQIGGPGLVQVNLEYAAMFESIDGNPQLIGPTADLPGHVHTLEGFERLRSIIDLRDHKYRYTDLPARTKEGIRVNLQDVEILFSVQRERNEKDLSRPYSFSRTAIHKLVYHHPPGHWAQAMIDLVQSDLLEFVRKHTLGELLAAVGEPEVSRQIQLETAIQNQIWRHRRYARAYRLSNQPRIPRHPKGYRPHQPPLRAKPAAKRRPPLRFNPGLIDVRRAPKFVPRTQLSNFFRDFTQGFPRRAQQHGVSLDWINVGTFYAPQEIIPNQHIEAWQLTSENLARCNERVLRELRAQSRMHELTRILRSPLETFIQVQHEDQPFAEQVASLIDDYEGKIHLALDSFVDARESQPHELVQAEQHIRKYDVRRAQSQGHYI